MGWRTLFRALKAALLFLMCHQVVCVDEKELTENLINLLANAHSLAGHIGNIIPAETGVKLGDGQPEVQTTSGLIYGAKNQYANSFFSIPFAVPPIKDLRYKPSVKLNTPGIRRNSSTFVETTCVQRKISLNEDCLVLSVHVPSFVDLSDSGTPPSTQLPVLLFIHGGAFIIGSGTKPMYDGRYLSHATSAIVVAMNYRLGPLGFLVFDDGKNVIDGNQGLGDQQLAMQWVNENIGKFGGDKNKVTLFGESAGAQSVMFHLLSKKSEAFYRNAIMESNPAAYWYPNRKQALELTNKFIEKLRCGIFKWKDCCNIFKSKYHCLMSASAKAIVSAMRRMEIGDLFFLHVLNAVEPFRPYIDGVEFTDQPLTLFKEGEWNNDKPIIIGTNKQELVIFPSYFPPGKWTYEKLNSMLFRSLDLGNKKSVGHLISEKYIQLYGSSVAKYNEIFGMQMTDIIFGCTTRALARFASYTTKSDVYYYIFDHPFDGPGCEKLFKPFLDMCGHSFHGSELFFVFRTKDTAGLITTVHDKLVSNQFSTYWGNMAQTGNPSKGTDFKLLGSFPEWIRYAKEPKDDAWTNLRIASPKAYLEQNYLGEVCDFWDSLGLYPAPANSYV